MTSEERVIFEETNKKGRKAEEIVINYLELNDCKVSDVSLIKEYQKAGFDLIVNDDIKVEIKQDCKMNITGNFFCEWQFNRTNYTEKGWGQKSTADYLFFYDGNSKIYVLDMQEYIKVMQVKGKYIRFPNKVDHCYGWAYLLPIAKANELGLIKLIINLDKAVDITAFFNAQKQVATNE